MKLITYCIFGILLLGYTLTSTAETTLTSSSTTASSLNSKVFESFSKHKLKVLAAMAKLGKNKSSAKANSSLMARKSAISEKMAHHTQNSAGSSSQEKSNASNLQSPIGPANTGSSNNSSSVPSVVNKGPKIWEGWVKFFAYNSSEEQSLLKGADKMKYYKNYDYFEQMKRNESANLEELSDGEYKYVHDPYSFYLTLFPTLINISSNRLVSQYNIL